MPNRLNRENAVNEIDRLPAPSVEFGVMSEKKSAPPQMIVSTFRLARWSFDLAVPKDRIPRESINMLTVVTIRPDKPIDISGTICAIIVFPARLNVELKLEQAAEGFPCRNESEAEQISEAIQAKNRKIPSVGLASWRGHFTLATISNPDFFREELVLFKFHKPQVTGSCRCGYALRIYRHFLDRPREKTWEEILRTTSARVAKKALARKQAELATEDAARKAKQNSPEAASDADLTAIQLKVLSKAYPRTVAFLSNPDSKNAEAAFQAYKQETLAATGHLIDTLTKSEFKEVAKLLERASRRKNPSLNDVEFQLVAGWRLHGYDKMTPDQRFHKLKELGFKPISPDAVRKMCERLKLPSKRKPGAPRKDVLAK